MTQRPDQDGEDVEALGVDDVVGEPLGCMCVVEHRGRGMGAVACPGFTNFNNYRVRPLLNAGKPNPNLLNTLTPQSESHKTID